MELKGYRVQHFHVADEELGPEGSHGHGQVVTPCLGRQDLVSTQVLSLELESWLLHLKVVIWCLLHDPSYKES